MDTKLANRLVRQSICRDMFKLIVVALTSLFSIPLIWDLMFEIKSTKEALLIILIYVLVIGLIYIFYRYLLMLEFAYLNSAVIQMRLGTPKMLDTFYSRKHSCTVMQNQKVLEVTIAYLWTCKFEEQATVIARHHDIPIENCKSMDQPLKQLFKYLDPKADLSDVMCMMEKCVYIFLVLSLLNFIGKFIFDK